MLDRLRAKRTASRERGASAVEYALLVAGIATLVVVVVVAFGGRIANIFNNTSDCIAGNGNASCGTTAPASPAATS